MRKTPMSALRVNEQKEVVVLCLASSYRKLVFRERRKSFLSGKP